MSPHGNGNGSRHPDEIMAEIERTRREMDSTLGAIEERLTPGQLLDQGMDYLKSSGAGDYVRNLRGSVSSNPLPIALVGIGLAWLAASDRMDRNRRTSLTTDTPYRNDWQDAWDTTDTGSASASGEGMKEGMKDKASHLKDKASGLLQRGKESVHGAGSSMHERASGTMDSLKGSMDSMKGSMGSMKERASGVMQSGRQRLDDTSRMARERMEQMRGGYDRIVEEQPLALGAIGVAIGAVLAALLPRSRKEEEMLAGARETVADKASELARQATDKGKEILDKGKQQVEQAKASLHQQAGGQSQSQGQSSQSQGQASHAQGQSSPGQGQSPHIFGESSRPSGQSTQGQGQKPPSQGQGQTSHVQAQKPQTGHSKPTAR